jgi:hypothetical protein
MAAPYRVDRSRPAAIRNPSRKQPFARPRLSGTPSRASRSGQFLNSAFFWRHHGKCRHCIRETLVVTRVFRCFPLQFETQSNEDLFYPRPSAVQEFLRTKNDMGRRREPGRGTHAICALFQFDVARDVIVRSRMNSDEISGRGATDFLAVGGEIGALMRVTDWTRTPLGPPQSLADQPENCGRHHAEFPLCDVRLVGAPPG